MATFLQIKDAVAAFLIDVPAVTLAAIPVLVNDAMHSLQTERDWVVQKAEVEATTTTARVLVAEPADWKAPRGNPWEVRDVGRSRELVWAADAAGLKQAWRTDDDGYPKALFLGLPDITGARNIEVWPGDQEDGPVP